jgi:hypothetical protein
MMNGPHCLADLEASHLMRYLVNIIGNTCIMGIDPASGQKEYIEPKMTLNLILNSLFIKCHFYAITFKVSNSVSPAQESCYLIVPSTESSVKTF